MEQCFLCAAQQWEILPAPHPTQSVRTDGAVVPQTLNKVQCLKCGLVKQERTQGTNLSALYTTDYNLYANRPQAEQFIGPRYRMLSNLIRDAILPLHSKRILEVGCGHGGTLQALQQLFPDAEFVGIEPVPQAAAQAATIQGLAIYPGMLHEVSAKHQLGIFDLVYSIHVIEHVDDPIEFLDQLKSYLNPEGRLFVSCPNGAKPNAELMRADHIFSFTPQHLAELCNRAKVAVLKAGTFYDTASPEQYVVAMTREADAALSPKVFASPTDLCQERQAYFQAWKKLDQQLLARIKPYQNMYCFGAGGFTALLAAYAPLTWQQIKGCIIDGTSEELFQGKRIHSMDDWDTLTLDALLIGTNPDTQPKIAARFQEATLPLIRWDDLIKR